ncbi:MAG: hypothetical protein IPJ85_07390 [Flavobacteriales bacterium]|nr:hypothetical protein [Flavobacteriales bacterium]
MKPLNLTNYEDHPTESNWIVFRFPTRAQADEFTLGLEAEGVQHEQDGEGGPPYLVAAKKHQREAAIRANYRVLGRHRKPFMTDPMLRWGVIGFFVLLLALAAAGALLR